MWQKRGGSQSPLCEARYGGSKDFTVERRVKEEKKMDRTTDYQQVWNFRVLFQVILSYCEAGPLSGNRGVVSLSAVL